MGTLGRQEVEALLVERISDVVGVDRAAVAPRAEFAADLHADSLDLVEIVESVEVALAERGFAVALPEEQLLALRTVADAVDALHAMIRGGAGR